MAATAMLVPWRNVCQCSRDLLGATEASRLCIRVAFVAVIAALSAPSGAHCEDRSLAGTTIHVTHADRPTVIPVSVDGKEYPFILDTGATGSAVDSTFGPQLGSPTRRIRAHTNDDPVTISIFRAPQITLGGKSLVDLTEVAAIDLSPMRYGTEIDIYGILGMDVLQYQVFQIDFDQGEIRFLEEVPRNAGGRVPIIFSRRKTPIIPVTVDVAGEKWFRIDTGTGVGFIEKGLFAGLLRDGALVPFRPTLAVSVAGPAEHCRARIREIAFCGFRHRGILFDEGNLNSLGTSVLSRYLVTFDFPGRAMYLMPGAHFAEPSRRGLSGARLWRPEGVTKIQFVHEGTPAAHAGLQIGDVIEELDGRPVQSFRLSEISERFATPGQYHLIVARGERRLSLTLVLEDPHDPWQEPPTAFAPPIREAAKLSP